MAYFKRYSGEVATCVSSDELLIKIPGNDN